MNNDDDDDDNDDDLLSNDHIKPISASITKHIKTTESSLTDLETQKDVLENRRGDHGALDRQRDHVMVFYQKMMMMTFHPLLCSKLFLCITFNILLKCICFIYIYIYIYMFCIFFLHTI